MTSDNDCPICQESLHDNLTVGCTVPCGHAFHQACYDTWHAHTKRKKKRKCPCCNATLTGFIEKIHITLPPISTNATDTAVDAVTANDTYTVDVCKPAVSSLQSDLESTQFLSEAVPAGAVSKSSRSHSRRKELSNQKAKRSALARYQQSWSNKIHQNFVKGATEKEEGEAFAKSTMHKGSSYSKEGPEIDSRNSRAKKKYHQWSSNTTSMSALLQRLSCDDEGNDRADHDADVVSEQRETSSYSFDDRKTNHAERQGASINGNRSSYSTNVEVGNVLSIVHWEEEINHVTNLALQKLELSCCPQKKRYRSNDHLSCEHRKKFVE